MLYRIHERLLIDSKNGVSIEGGEGRVHSLSMLSKKTHQILLKVGAISEVQAPPLETFTNWAGRARKLSELGIDTIGFVTMEAHDIAYAIRASVQKGEEGEEAEGGEREGDGQDEFDLKVDKLAQAVERWQHEIKQYLGIGDAAVRR